ncbi:MAG: DNA polymerase III subunit gamma/tau [Clostridiaceae bacterium]|nr:DNA polymerase III subunit gamma/tau [Clostridiaceae bacterium]
MAHIALYRKWRPAAFDDVVEQQHIVTTLKNSIINNTISHAYLFCGTRGTGKTTLAKIFAKAVNCLNQVDGNPCNECSICKGINDGSVMDVVEIDAASNNGVDDVREIKEAVMYVPALTRYKVYIIDEVHMLSTGAFNALLKTLEEPPENVVFILATTEPHKIPATILSRCQRFDFKRISLKGIAERLKVIARDTGVSFDDNAIYLIARLSQGGMRDAISLLDQCISLGKSNIKRQDVADIAGLAASEAIKNLAHSILNRDVQEALSCIKTAMDEGKDLVNLCSQLIEWFRNLMLLKTGGEAEKLIELDQEELQWVRESADNTELNQIINIIRELSETEGKLKWSENQRILFEVTMVKLCSLYAGEGSINVSTGISEDRLNQIESRLQEIEKNLNLIKIKSDTIVNSENIYTSSYVSTNKSAGSSGKPEVKGSRTRTEAKKEDSKPKELHKSVEPETGNPEYRRLEDWPKIVEGIRASNKMKVYVYLLDTECMIKDRTAYIIVPGEDNLKKTVLNRSDSINTIKEAFLKTMGMDVEVKITDEKSIGEQKSNDDADPVLEKLMAFAQENHIELKIEE